jgi:glucose/arabinose dehydrogenase
VRKPRRTTRLPAPAVAVAVTAVLASAACSDSTEPPGAAGHGLAVQVVASGLSAPLHLTAPAADARLFVVEQPGRIRIIREGALLAAPFLDITDRVRSGGERGLLSLAFHPDYAANGFFYVDYTDADGNTRVERYEVNADPDVADPGSAHLILQVTQPYSNHNGGHILFGPDGMLYIGMGDGGSGGDPRGNGQNLDTLLGKLLRIDVDGGDPFAIPSDNPFAGNPDARGEIWAYGLRNPWRMAFDPPSGLLYIADVGQNAWEEVNAVPAASAGLNYGWNVMEGLHCYSAPGCDETGLTLPVFEYGHVAGCSVTGGLVYRGAAIPFLQGHYLFSDYCASFLWSFRMDGGAATDLTHWEVGDPGPVLSFGEDAAGEVYILSQNGTVYRIVATN